MKQTNVGIVVISMCLAGVLSLVTAATVQPEDVQLLGTFPGTYFKYCELFRRSWDFPSSNILIRRAIVSSKILIYQYLN